jgi:hypothetical protein
MTKLEVNWLTSDNPQFALGRAAEGDLAASQLACASANNKKLQINLIKRTRHVTLHQTAVGVIEKTSFKTDTSRGVEHAEGGIFHELFGGKGV